MFLIVYNEQLSYNFNLFLDIETQASSEDPEEGLYKAEPLLDDMEFEASQEFNEMLVDEDPPWTPEEIDSTHAKTDDDATEECEKTR